MFFNLFYRFVTFLVFFGTFYRECTYDVLFVLTVLFLMFLLVAKKKKNNYVKIKKTNVGKKEKIDAKGDGGD